MNNKKEEKNKEAFALPKGLFVELTNESQQQILADKSIKNKGNFIDKDKKIIPLGGGLTFIPN